MCLTQCTLKGRDRHTRIVPGTCVGRHTVKKLQRSFQPASPHMFSPIPDRRGRPVPAPSPIVEVLILTGTVRSTSGISHRYRTLIEEVRKFPVYYDQSSEKYRNTEYNENVWKKITENDNLDHVKQHGPNINEWNLEPYVNTWLKRHCTEDYTRTRKAKPHPEEEIP
ncbi:hypothetical protein J6590_023181 [Homalodisca vitripennis]|nr:hypothetical protein J6590_023181 [Homalodisca vitripennis]